MAARPLPGFYGLTAALAAISLLLLAGVYLVFVVGIVGATLWYAWAQTGLLHVAGQTPVFRLMIGLFLYGGPLVVGSTLTFFLLKPLFRSPERTSTPYALTPASEPALFDFIAQICAWVNAPVPRRVVLDLWPNASASLRRGGLTLADDGLELTVGLPLVAALDTRQFAGVLAHEFGHFTQRGGMRLSYVVMRLAGWLARVVYERDEWDVALAAASRGGTGGGVLLSCLNIVVYVARLLLRLLMLAGQAAGCALSRQMEDHADRYEVAVAGSAAFVATARALQAMQASCRATYPVLLRTYEATRRLPADLPRYLVAAAGQLPEPTQAEVNRVLAETPTRWLDTHPAWRDRIRAALAANEQGLFERESPASSLFRDFAGLSRQLTCLHYRQDLGLDVTEQHLVPVDDWKPWSLPAKPPVIDASRRAG